MDDRPRLQRTDFALEFASRGGLIEDPEHQSQAGAWVRGEVNLSVDPFFYFDELASEAGFPSLIYTWAGARLVS